MPPRLAGDEVALWYWTTDALDDQALHALDDLLSPDEQARRDRFVFARDRRDYTAAHALLRRALSECCGGPETAWTFETDRYGKPAVSAGQAGSPPLAINLSHTHGLVACAITRGARVGIDVERIGIRLESLDIAERFFAPAEVRALQTAAPGHRHAQFAEFWTLKEAYIKALGLGLNLPLDSFAFRFEGGSDLDFTADDADRWSFLLAAPTADARLALAVEDPAEAGRRRVRIRGVGNERMVVLRASRGIEV